MPTGKENNMNEANVLSKLVDKIRSKKPQQQNNPYVKHLGGNSYEIGKNIVQNLYGMTKDEVMSYDWGKRNLRFLYQGRWQAKEIKIDPQKEEVYYFWGTWYDGDFIGNFTGVFNGGRFFGNFQGSYKNFKAHPSSFIGGTCSSYQDGVLGIPKIDSLYIEKKSSRDSVSLLELKENSYITIIDSYNLFYSFQVSKNVDNSSADIVLQSVGDGSNSSFLVEWKEVTQQSGGDSGIFDSLTSFVIGQKVKIPNLSSFIKGQVFSIEVSLKGAAPTQNQSLPTVYKLNMDLLDPLQYSAPQGKKPVVTLHFLGQDEVKKFQKLKNQIEKGEFAMHLNNIIQGIYHGYITGYDNHLALSWLFNDIQGSPVKGEQFKNSMKWMEDFVLLVPERFVKSKTQGGKYVKNDRALISFEKKMKALVGPYLSRIKQQPQGGKSKSKRKSVIPEGEVRSWIYTRMKQNILK